MCMIVNLGKGLLYNRWMGTIALALSDDSSKCVVFTTITGYTLKNKTLHWDEYIKRALELPKNKYLISVEGTIIDEEIIYFVQEHLNCKTLEVRLKKNFDICSRNASNALMMMTSEMMRHILGILEGLELLQSYGFLHPGMCAKKVLLTNRGICKLYDFCLEEDACNVVSVKKSQMVCGRNQFAPEALIRNEYIKASDVWSAANLIWEILSGAQ
ncbi:Ephrin type-A receptor 5 [Holothuria leucospilota]|uniref:Ephrin type-A receptor 5 n=1 Tax=Holothuria leucospilota TaxID=206669 RepID=A0A9Q1C494_HOLLE|nr:Ephrin type-A receptor 5 [Holothuria leucospilota]